ncbi:discoidin domain-containing protein [Collinsella sp. zg1085]|uniref:discoidin domain-containing protein n=1 Tax=Collinsella sp. zg1085 TaxID=2844380 RepID=UPI001C0BB9DD|nr:discoidin domain-containing protein [Collinsella sp. zg1085]QWT17379.1 discoidin domain-containing protein [Collinsella sp. zg1085]
MQGCRRSVLSVHGIVRGGLLLLLASSLSLMSLFTVPVMAFAQNQAPSAHRVFAAIAAPRTRAEEAPSVRSATSTQMSSAPERFYINRVSNPDMRTQNFDGNWKFKLGDASGAENPSFDDSAWEHINLPHDYSIDQERTRAGEAESSYLLGGIGWYRKAFEVGKELAGKRLRIDFDGIYMDATVYVNGKKLATHPYGYSPFGIDITSEVKVGAQNFIAVSVNHQTPSSRWYSGSGIGRTVELVVTDQVHVSKDGVVVTTPELAAGKTQNVRTHLATTVENGSTAPASVTLEQSIFKVGGDPAAPIVTNTAQAVEIAAAGRAVIETNLIAPAPELWSTASPNLYTVRTQVKVNGVVVDTYDTEFGYRFFSFDANEGFLLNGEHIKLKGVCLHNDQGALGSVDTEAALRRQVRILKDMGANSIRTSHNTPPRALVKICNEEGILLDLEVFDGWTADKNGNVNDYARFFNKAIGETRLEGAKSSMTWAEFDLKQSIARDINAPSIIMWSVGNEMITGASRGFDATAHESLLRWVGEADRTRPVTLGDNQLLSGRQTYNPQKTHEAGGIIGINYSSLNNYDNQHRLHPDWRFYGSETASAVNSRGVYSTQGSMVDAGGMQLTSYDTSAVSWGHVASQAWYATIARDFVAGEYVWTGFDYLGEPTPWNGVAAGSTDRNPSWPSPKSSYFGIIDTAGLPKDSFYFYQSQWNDAKHTLHILPVWNEELVVKRGADKRVPVVVYTDAPAVELWLRTADGTEKLVGARKQFTKKTTPAGYEYQIFGENSTNHRDLYLTWDVPFEAGTLYAKAFDAQGNPIDTAGSEWDGRKSVSSAGPAKRLLIEADRSSISANGDDLSYLTVSILDAEGRMVPDATNRVTFSVEGAGTLAGVDNGSSPDHQSFRDSNRAAHAGQLVGIVRANTAGGTLRVTARAEGLESATATIAVAPVSGPSAEKAVDNVKFSRFHYVKRGSELELPKTAEVTYVDGSVTGAEEITWDEVNPALLGELGTFTVNGTVAGAQIEATVLVLDNVAAMLNYSAMVPAGQVPIMPDARPAVMADGQILNVSFPVTWKMPTADAFKTEGVVYIDGTANVFGVDVAVHAKIRVERERVSVGENVAHKSNATLSELTQSVPEGLQSDSLSAVNDGDTAYTSAGSGGSNRRWTNYAFAQADANNTRSSITFRYNTQTRFAQARVHFFTDDYTAYYPDAGTTKMYISADGTEGSWTEVPVRETITDVSQNVKRYTLDFDPVAATFVKLEFKNPAGQPAAGGRFRKCIGITEIELMKAEGSYSIGSAAALESLAVNGQVAPKTALGRGAFETRALMAEVAATGKDNAAVTVLPAYNDEIKILLESEDHSKMSSFSIKLNTAPEKHLEDYDYPVDNLKLSAGTEKNPPAGNDGPIAYAFDGNEATMWHGAYDNTDAGKLWAVMELKKPASVFGLRYLPRADGSNGTVSEYLVQYSDDGTTWKNAATGTWDTGAGWKIASFDKPVSARFIRFTGLETVSLVADRRFISAAELRLSAAAPTVDIADAEQVAIKVPSVVTVDRIDGEHPVGAMELDERVTHGDKTLVYGMDYLLSFANNTAQGTATVTIEGIGAYSGTVTRTFKIEKAEPVLAGIAVKTAPTKTVYTEGETLNPAGLVLALTMSDGTVSNVAYDADTAGSFGFNPVLTTVLTAADNLDFTVSYGGKTAVFSVSVMAHGTQVDPQPGEATPGSSSGEIATPNPGTEPGQDIPAPPKSGTGAGVVTQPNSTVKPGLHARKNARSLPSTGDLLTVTIGLSGAAVVVFGVAMMIRRWRGLSERR